MNTPNLITLGRALMVPIVFWLVITGHDKAAFVLFLAAGISDGVDGYIARHYNQRTELGAYLDPLADKLLLVSIFIGLGLRGDLPSWLVVAAVARDALILSAVILSSMLRRPVEIAPLMVSKMNTVAQITLAAFVLADEAFNLSLTILRTGLVWLTAALTIGSLLAYLRNWITHMSQD